MTRARTVFIALVIASAATATLLAHMKASKMEPAADSTVAAPSQIQVWFTQAPDPKVSKLEVTGPSGPVKTSDFKVTTEKSIVAKVAGALGNGKYSVKWQAAGDDGHVQKGEFAFTVQSTR